MVLVKQRFVDAPPEQDRRPVGANPTTIDHPSWSVR